jgi:hypothetical protein
MDSRGLNESDSDDELNYEEEKRELKKRRDDRKRLCKEKKLKEAELKETLSSHGRSIVTAFKPKK